MIETIYRLFEYDEWAIARILDSLKSMPSRNKEALRPLAHLLVAEKVWILRLQGQDTSMINLSPDFSLAECENLANENQKAYEDFLNKLIQDDLASFVTYKNSKGAEFSTSVGDILMHAALHGTYHRGQIAAAVREAEVIPVNTDFITFVREVRAE